MLNCNSSVGVQLKCLWFYTMVTGDDWAYTSKFSEPENLVLIVCLLTFISFCGCGLLRHLSAHTTIHNILNRYLLTFLIQTLDLSLCLSLSKLISLRKIKTEICHSTSSPYLPRTHLKSVILFVTILKSKTADSGASLFAQNSISHWDRLYWPELLLTTTLKLYS